MAFEHRSIWSQSTSFKGAKREQPWVMAAQRSPEPRYVLLGLV